jgi:phosphoglucomutase
MIGLVKDVPLIGDRRKKLNKIIKNPPNKFAGRKVEQIETIDGLKLDLENDDWILFRLSGTEPLIRCYAEAGSGKEVSRLMNAAMERLQ